MSKIFYDHLVVREEVLAVLDEHNLSVQEREELVQLIDETLHHRVLDTILSNLPSEKHEKFLALFAQSPHDIQLLEYLKTETKIDIESKIKETAAKTKKELLSEIKRAKKK